MLGGSHVFLKSHGVQVLEEFTKATPDSLIFFLIFFQEA
jgi:hypothetical protein